MAYLRNNPSNIEDMLLEFFFGQPWEEYLNEMSLYSTYDNQITLQATLDKLGVRLTTISTIRVEGRVVISLTFTIASNHYMATWLFF